MQQSPTNPHTTRRSVRGLISRFQNLVKGKATGIATTRLSRHSKEGQAGWAKEHRALDARARRAAIPKPKLVYGPPCKALVTKLIVTRDQKPPYEVHRRQVRTHCGSTLYQLQQAQPACRAAKNSPPKEMRCDKCGRTR